MCEVAPHEHHDVIAMYIGCPLTSFTYKPVHIVLDVVVFVLWIILTAIHDSSTSVRLYKTELIHSVSPRLLHDSEANTPHDFEALTDLR